MSESFPALELLLQQLPDIDEKRVAFIQAFAHPRLREIEQKAQELTLVQSFKPEIINLNRMGLEAGELHGSYDRILLIPGKDKVQSLGWMALAFAHMNPGATLMMACENRYGARSYESALKKLAGSITSSSKSKCRFMSAKKTDALDEQLLNDWRKDAEPRRMETHGLWAQPGLFSWKSADAGSTLLLEHLPELAGEGMDLCAGYGLLTADILERSPNVTRAHLVEAEGLALMCAEKSMQKYGQKIQLHHLDAIEEKLPDQLDWVVCNPPFHTGQSRDVDLGKQIVERACDALKKGGVLYLVANRQLPYENIIKAKMQQMEIVAVGNGFKVIYGKR